MRNHKLECLWRLGNSNTRRSSASSGQASVRTFWNRIGTGEALPTSNARASRTIREPDHLFTRGIPHFPAARSADRIQKTPKRRNYQRRPVRAEGRSKNHPPARDIRSALAQRREPLHCVTLKKARQARACVTFITASCGQLRRHARWENPPLLLPGIEAHFRLSQAATEMRTQPFSLLVLRAIRGLFRTHPQWRCSGSAAPRE